MLDGGRLFQRLVNVFLQRQLRSAPPAIVGRQLHLGPGIVVAIGDGLGRKPRENHRVHRTQPGTGQHGDRQLGHHRHVNRHHVAVLDAQRLEHVGEEANFAMQLAISQRAGIARLAFPDDRGLVRPPGGEVGVETVVRDVRLAADEPAGVGLVPLQHPLERPKPVQLAGQAPPEAFDVAGRFVPHLLISGQRADAGGFGEFLWRRKKPLLLHHRVEFAARVLCHCRPCGVCESWKSPEEPRL